MFRKKRTSNVVQVILGLRLSAVKQEAEFNSRFFWAILWHHLVGYALFILIIANIFQGIEKCSPAKKWNWCYGVILGIFSSVALALELHMWIIRSHRI